MVWHFDAFNAHDGHEIISWIREIRTFEIYIGEIFHRFVRIVEVYDVTLGEKDEFINNPPWYTRLAWEFHGRPGEGPPGHELGQGTTMTVGIPRSRADEATRSNNCITAGLLDSGGRGCEGAARGPVQGPAPGGAAAYRGAGEARSR